MPRVIPPIPDEDDQPFWDGVARDQLLLQRCADCATVQHPPSPMCLQCHSVRREWFEASGRGSDVALDDIAPGLPVAVSFSEIDGTRLPVFTPVKQG